MNPEICKKCRKWWFIRKKEELVEQYTGEKLYFGYQFACLDIPITENSHDLGKYKRMSVPIKKKTFELMKKNSVMRKISPWELFYFDCMLKLEKVPGELVSNMKNIEMKEECCPYYMEHLITEWNK